MSIVIRVDIFYRTLRLGNEDTHFLMVLAYQDGGAGLNANELERRTALMATRRDHHTGRFVVFAKENAGAAHACMGTGHSFLLRLSRNVSGGIRCAFQPRRSRGQAESQDYGLPGGVAFGSMAITVIRPSFRRIDSLGARVPAKSI